jgi:hypothetical protein
MEHCGRTTYVELCKPFRMESYKPVYQKPSGMEPYGGIYQNPSRSMKPYGEVYHDPSGRNYLEHLNPSGWDHMERCKSTLQDRTIWSNVPEPFRMEPHGTTYQNISRCT